jgi:hypothetical protein
MAYGKKSKRGTMTTTSSRGVTKTGAGSKPKTGAQAATQKKKVMASGQRKVARGRA